MTQEILGIVITCNQHHTFTTAKKKKKKKGFIFNGIMKLH